MSYRDLVLADSPVGYWRFDDDLTDESGNGNHGSGVGGGPTFVAGLIDEGGKAGEFNGADQSVQVEDDPTLDMTDALTVEAWIRPDADAAGDIFFSKRDNDFYSWELALGVDDTFLARVNDNANVAQSTVTFAGGELYHVVMTYDRTSIKLYLNGVLEAEFPYTDAITTSDVAVAIGQRNYTGAEGFFAGVVDEAALYDRALTHAEVMEHYRAGKLAELGASGILARHEAGDADFPFDAEDWDGGAEFSEISVQGDGDLYLNEDSAGWACAIHTGVSSRSAAYLQGLLGTPGGTWGGVSAHAQSTHLDHVTAAFSVGRSPEATALIEKQDGDTVLDETVAARSLNTFYRIALVVDGTSAELYDFDNDLALTLSTTFASGEFGIAVSGDVREVREFFVCTDRYLEVTGLPENTLVEVLDAADTVLASASADALGVATVDLMDVVLPASKVRVGEGAEVWEPALGVWPGDSYDGSSVTFNSPPDTPTCSVRTLDVDTLVLESSPFSDPDGDGHAASHWQVQEAGGDWSAPLHDSGEDAVNLTEWDVPDPTTDVELEARVRHKDDSGDAGTEWSEWSAATAPFTVPSSTWQACREPEPSPDDVMALGPQAWYESDYGVFKDAGATEPPDDGDFVLVWEDKSGNGRHLSDADAPGSNTPPEWDESEAALYFPAHTRRLFCEASWWDTTEPFTIFWVSGENTDFGGVRIFLSVANPDNEFHDHIKRNHETDRWAFGGDDVNEVWVDDPSELYTILTARKTAGTTPDVDLRVDGGRVSATGSVSKSASDWPPTHLALGGPGWGTSDGIDRTWVKALIIFPVVLTDEDMRTVERYLIAKYGGWGWEACPEPESSLDDDPYRFFTDFGDYAIGALENHADWDIIGTPGWWEVVALAGSTGDQVVRVSRPNGDIYNFARWLAPGIASEVLEVVMRVRFINVTSGGKLLAAMVGVDGNPIYYGGGVEIHVTEPDAEMLVLLQNDVGYAPLIDLDAPFDVTSGGWFWARVQHDDPNTRLKMRMWQGTPDDEPAAWDFDHNVSAKGLDLIHAMLAYGGLGGDGQAEVDIVGVGLEGATAPTEPGTIWEDCGAGAPATAWEPCS